MNRVVKISIVESSPIIRLGVEEIISQSTSFEVVEDGCDIVLVSVQTLLRMGKKEVENLYPAAKIGGIHYNYATPNELAQCDFILDISMNQEQIIQLLLQSAKEQKTAVDSQLGESEELSDREKEVVCAVAKGLINKEIADHLNISIHTVMAHRKNISRKTGIRSISGLVVYALLNNIIEQSEVLK